MRILVLGDIHGYTGTLDIPTIEVAVDIVNQTDADFVLQVGDMGGYRHFSKPVYWIFGNNDALSMMKPAGLAAAASKNLFNVRTGEIVTFSDGEEQIRISGMNGAYDPLYIEYDREKLQDLGYFTESDVEKCLQLENIDIFLVHGCPSGLDLGREPDHAVPFIRAILDAVKPRYMFCGHGHFFKKAVHDGCQIYSLDLASKEYYVLDTRKDVFSINKIDAARLPVIKQMTTSPFKR
ncbi:metallophosphoesterase [Thermodesulfobacteriota bacterium]